MLQTPAAFANTCTGMSGTSNAEDIVPRTSGRGEQRDPDVQSRRQMHGQNKLTATLSTEEESPRASVAVAFGPFQMGHLACATSEIQKVGHVGGTESHRRIAYSHERCQTWSIS